MTGKDLYEFIAATSMCDTKAIAAHFAVTSATASKRVHDLIDAGLVVGGPHPDHPRLRCWTAGPAPKAWYARGFRPGHIPHNKGDVPEKRDGMPRVSSVFGLGAAL